LKVWARFPNVSYPNPNPNKVKVIENGAVR